ncbi:MAG: hypothetical protein ABI488_01685 [Polyangiaceae bacterium]
MRSLRCRHRDGVAVNTCEHTPSARAGSVGAALCDSGARGYADGYGQTYARQASALCGDVAFALRGLNPSSGCGCYVPQNRVNPTGAFLSAGAGVLFRGKRRRAKLRL